MMPNPLSQAAPLAASHAAPDQSVAASHIQR